MEPIPFLNKSPAFFTAMDVRGKPDDQSLLLDLFPVPSGPITADLLGSTLKKYQTLIKLSKEALTKLQRRMMPFFDPLGGEHGCHIRAAFFAELLNSDGIDELVKSTIAQLDEHAATIDSLLKNSVKKGVKADSIKSFLAEHHALLPIPERVLVIISSFLLSETKVIEYRLNEISIPNRHESIPYKHFSEKKGINPNLSRALIKVAQEELSRISVRYVQQVALQVILNKEYSIAANLVYGKHVRLDEKRRAIIPCFPTMRLLLAGLHARKIPLVIKISQYVEGCEYSYGQLLLVYSNQGGDGYEFVSKYKQPFPKGVFCIHAKSITKEKQSTLQFEERILSHGIEELILSAAADHPQYGCDDTDPPSDPEREAYRAKAYEWGACRANPSLFLIDHMYCDMIDMDVKGNLVQSIYLSAKQNAADLYQAITDSGEFAWFRLRLICNSKVIPVARLYGSDQDPTYSSKRELNLTYGSLIWAIEFRENPTQRVYPNRLYKLIIHD